MTEKELQDRCLEICGRYDLRCLHIRNESGTAERRALGMRKGVPDLFIVGDSSFMFVELKRNETLSASKEQADFMELLSKNKILNRLCGSETQFMKALKRLNSMPQKSLCGIAYGVKSCNGNDIYRVSKFYREKIGTVEDARSLFALKLFTTDDRRFPWLCNLEQHYFVATRPTDVTTRLLRAGWDVCFV